MQTQTNATGLRFIEPPAPLRRASPRGRRPSRVSRPKGAPRRVDVNAALFNGASLECDRVWPRASEIWRRGRGSGRGRRCVQREFHKAHTVRAMCLHSSIASPDANNSAPFGTESMCRRSIAIANLKRVAVSAAFVDMGQPGWGAPGALFTLALTPIIFMFKAPRRLSCGTPASENHPNMSLSKRSAAKSLVLDLQGLHSRSRQSIAETQRINTPKWTVCISSKAKDSAGDVSSTSLNRAQRL